MTVYDMKQQGQPHATILTLILLIPKCACVDLSRQLRFQRLEMTKDKEQQRAEIRFCMNLGLSRVDTRRHLVQVHGGQALSQSQVNRWFLRIQNENDPTLQLKDHPRNTTPRKVTPNKVQEIRDVLRRNPNSTCRQIATDTGLSNGTVHKTLRKKMDLKKKSAKWVPHHLTPAQMQRRVQCSRAALQLLRRRGGAPHIITGDESWFWTWEPGSKASTKVWLAPGEERSQKPRQEMSTPKCMLILFFDDQGLVFQYWVPQGHGVNARLYSQVLAELKEAVRRRRPQFRRNWALLHDNAPAHRSDLAQRFLQRHGIQQVPHPAYSPDLSPCDYWIFAKLKKMVSGHRYQNVHDMMTAVDAAIGQVTRNEWADAMARYAPRLRKCIAAQGRYFERS